jgi:hypothetical protein
VIPLSKSPSGDIATLTRISGDVTLWMSYWGSGIRMSYVNTVNAYSTLKRLNVNHLQLW